ncbi:hypothetical protein [Streptomyces sp. NPDC003401]
MRELSPKQAAATATRLRSSLKGTKPAQVPPRDRGVLLDDHLPSGVELRGSDEDTYVAIMAPRAGKSTSLAISVAEEAPGVPLEGRSDVGVRHWGVAQAERRMWWDMIAQAETFEGVERLASHFVT